MANLTAVFELVDRISDKLDSIASRGGDVIDRFETMGDAADVAVGEATSAIDGVATAVSDYSQTVEGAAGTTDYWTDAVGNYDKSALEAVHSTEELVEMGLKSAEALEEERSVMELAQMATDDLNEALTTSTSVHDECSEAMQRAAEMAEKIADSDNISEQAKIALQEATESASTAFEELEEAQQAAQAAMDNYNAVAESGTATITELEAAALNAATAADKLVEANEKAASATEDLSKATEDASKEAENANDKGVGAIEGVASALAAAGITATVKEIAENVYALADAFSEAESTVVLATGATGDALDGLTDSMMDAYAASKTGSLDETAAAVGEINTRLGYTDEQLTETTELFLDFAAVTGGNAASSVKSVTQLMNQWHVPAEDMEKTLSKLTYAGQASGISVDTLSGYLVNNKAILDQLGFSLDEATAMFMNFELAGTNTTAVMTGFRTALSSGAISSLEELYDVFDQISSGAMSAADASELFGTRAGPAIVNAVNDGTLSLDSMVAALENADGTLGTTAEAAQTLDQKWEQASNNIGAAFTNAVQPTLDGLSSGFADIVNSIGSFLNEHPAVVKAITAIGVGIGVVVAGVAGVTFVTTVAIPAVSAFGVALNAALGPIGWVALAITGIVAAGTALVAMMGDAEDETAEMTAVTRKQYYELQDLNAEYEEACEKYGENSEEALRLKYQVDDLSEAFENSRQTLEEFQAEVDDLCTSTSELWDNFHNSITEINQQETSALALIQKYEDLTEQATLTAGEQKQLEAVTKSLAESYPDLAAKLDDATYSAEQYVEALKKAAEEEAQQQRQEEAQDAYVEALKKRAELTDEIAKAEENLRLSQESDANASFLSDAWFYNNTGWLGTWATDTDEYQDALEELNAAMEENEAEIADLEAGFEKLAAEEQEAAEAGVTYEEACSTALEEVKDRVDDLCAAYDEAYQSALSSFEGQFGLFDEASTKSEDYLNASVENAQKALDSQLSYWETYNANLETLTSYGEGLTGEARENYELLLSYAQDGSEEAAGLAASMADAIEQGDTEAINKLSETVGAVKQKQEEAAAATAEWQTDFNAQMDEIVSGMSERIGEMGFEDEANQAALETMQSYAAGIQSGSNEAITECEAVATAISSALEASEVKAKISTELDTSAVDDYTVPDKTATAEYELDSKVVDEYQPEDKLADAVYEVDSTEVDNYDPPDKTATVTYNVQTNGTVPGHATGTTYAEDMFIAGEDGPELIVGQQGSTVFPHSETEQIIDAMSKQNEAVTVVNEYEPTGFMDKLENAFSKLTGKMSALFEKIGGITPTVELEGYATGTTSSEDSFIAGEDGPELVLGHSDSTVFPSDETDRVVDAVMTLYNKPTERTDDIYVPVATGNVSEDKSAGGDEASTRKILLEIAGKGNIELTGGKVDKEMLLSFLYEYLKPVLSEILTQEIYEEGDMAYEY